LQEWQSQLDDAAKQLGQTLEDLNAGGFRRFLSVRPDWQGLARPASLKAMDPDRCAQLGAKLVSELTAYAMKDTQGQTQTAAKAMWDAETQLVFRTKVRLAALARMALVLDSVAAAQYLDGGGNKREALDRILACEDLVLPIPKAEWAAPPPLPRLEDDLAQADMILQLAATDDPAKASALHLGGQAPELNLVPYRGETPSIGNGKPLLLFFWATWCKPCKAVVPKLLALARNRNLTVLAISHESESDLDRFFASSPDFPEFVSRDPEGRSISRLGQRTIPTFLLLDGQGKLASKIVHSPEELPPNGDE